MMNIASNGGIGNRLRTMIGYAAVYQSMGRRQMPRFIWLDTKHAPPNHDAFRIMGAEIVDMEQADENTIVVPGTIDVPLMFRTHDLPDPSYQTVLDAYGLIDFSPQVREKASQHHTLAVHLRMGDIASEERFQRFHKKLRSMNSETPIYLACDDVRTFDRLRKDFNVINYSTFRPISGSLRQTSIFDSAVDMLMCVNAISFLGTADSSFSQMISLIRQFNRRIREKC